MTPLLVAAQHGAAECAALLIARGADVDARDDDVTSALHLAVDGEREGVIRVLLEHGADPLIPDHEGYTPLDWARVHGPVCLEPVTVALAPAEHGRLLLRAREAMDAARAIAQADQGDQSAGARGEQAKRPRSMALAAAPRWSQRRVERSRPLPSVAWVEGGDPGLRALVNRLVGVDEGSDPVPSLTYLLPEWWYRAPARKAKILADRKSNPSVQDVMRANFMSNIEGKQE